MQTARHTGASPDDQAKIRQLLSEQKLPHNDLDFTKTRFWLAREGQQIVGIAAIETYGKVGLLRSVAVSDTMKGRKVGSLLVQSALRSVQGDLEQVVLLTETAQQWFPRFGFEVISRGEVPASVQASSEFSHVCPVSAVAMRKILGY